MKSIALSALIFMSFAGAQAMTCENLFQRQNSRASFVSLIDFKVSFDERSIEPDQNLLVINPENFELLSHLEGLPLRDLAENTSIVETDYGYAVVNTHDLKHWLELEAIIADPASAQHFIKALSNGDLKDYDGLLYEDVGWLKVSRFSDVSYPWISEIPTERRNDFLKWLKKMDTFMYPYGSDLRDYELKRLTAEDAQYVLKVLARRFITSHLYVKNKNGYQKLEDTLKDSSLGSSESMMLLSRFPTLIPSYFLFIKDYYNSTLSPADIPEFSGKTARYPIAQVTIFDSQTEQHRYVIGISSRVSLTPTFKPKLEAHFRLHYLEELLELRNRINEETYYRNEEQGLDLMENYLTKKSDEFEKLTGYQMPVAAAIHINGFDYSSNEFIVTFATDDTPEHVLAAFYVFIGSQ